jgi:hypothetical protein
MNQAKSGLGLSDYAIIVLTLATALIHLSLQFPDVMFILNGLGYLGLLAATYLSLPVAKDNPRLVRWAYLGFTAVSILAWVAIGDKSWPAGMLGYITKLIEVALLALLWMTRK